MLTVCLLKLARVFTLLSRHTRNMKNLLQCILVTTLVTKSLCLGRLKEHYSWSQIDYSWPNSSIREAALSSGSYVPQNLLPLGLEASSDRLFISLPKWRSGIPVTLTSVPITLRTSIKSPLLNPYPSWEWYQPNTCDILISAFRMKIDACERLWVVDNGGIINDVKGNSKICGPKLVIFDLKTDKVFRIFELPPQVILSESMFINIEIELIKNECNSNDAFAYIADVRRGGLVVYSLLENKAWRINHEYFLPDPMACVYKIGDIRFRFLDGIFGMALSPDLNNDRKLFFHPMSSFREFSVPSSALRNSSTIRSIADMFDAYFPRGSHDKHSSASAMSKDGVLFYSLVTQNALGCWNIKKIYRPIHQGIVDQDSIAMQYSSDLKIDSSQNIWVMTNRLHLYFFGALDPSDVNFRVLTAKVADAVKGTVCEDKPTNRPHYVNHRNIGNKE